MTTADQLILPGRLGKPDMAIGEDPRADPRMIAAMVPFALNTLGAPPPLDASAPLDQLLAFCTAAEAGFEGLFAALAAELPPVTNVERSVETLKGPDGNDITLYIHRPAGAAGPLPGMLHIHGGGMVILEAAGPLYTHMRDVLAATGMVIVGVEYRNGGGKHGPYPFPAGLNDCSTALGWMASNRSRLGVGKLIVAGESGGANLTLALAIRAKREGRLGEVDGVYAMCPFISNGYVNRPPNLPSLIENDRYFVDCATLSILAKVYDPDDRNATNPLAWPLFATPDDLKGLPPHVISVNHLDPLRDEGLAYFRKLADAGVSVACRTVNGTCHGGELFFCKAMPEAFAATLRDIKGFADAL